MAELLKVKGLSSAPDDVGGVNGPPLAKMQQCNMTIWNSKHILIPFGLRFDFKFSEKEATLEGVEQACGGAIVTRSIASARSLSISSSLSCNALRNAPNSSLNKAIVVPY